MKQKCFKCGHKAVWYYMPDDRHDEPGYNRASKYYCETHVSRGCSCNMNDDGTQPVDDNGREYPCCEYDYDENGYDEDNG